jgi:hypothetical protein
MVKQVVVALRDGDEAREDKGGYGKSCGPDVVKSEIEEFFSRRADIGLLKFSWRRA